MTDDCFDAACVDALETIRSQCYNEWCEMRGIAEEVGSIAPLDLRKAYWEADMSGTLRSNRSRDLIEVSEHYAMTIVLDDRAEKLSDAALADLALGCWDDEWDD